MRMLSFCLPFQKAFSSHISVKFWLAFVWQQWERASSASLQKDNTLSLNFPFPLWINTRNLIKAGLYPFVQHSTFLTYGVRWRISTDNMTYYIWLADGVFCLWGCRGKEGDGVFAGKSPLLSSVYICAESLGDFCFFLVFWRRLAVWYGFSQCSVLTLL